MVSTLSRQNELTPPPHLSPSSISTFRQCPLKFKYSKIDLIPEKPQEAAVMGNFVHDVLEELYKLAPEDRTMDNARSIAKNQWGEQWGQKSAQVVHTDEAIRKFRWSAWWCIENLWKLEDPTLVAPQGLEHELYGQIGGVTVKGFIDRFSFSDGTTFLKISDYKTGKTPREPFVDDKFFQLLVYSHLTASTGVGDVAEVELLYLKDGVRFTKKVTKANLKETLDIVVETKEEIDFRCKEGMFEPNKSILCNWCSYKTICPVWSRQ